MDKFRHFCLNNTLNFTLKRHITIKHKPVSNLPFEPCPPVKSCPQIISSPAKVPPPKTSPPIPSRDVSPPHCYQWEPHPRHIFKCNTCNKIFTSMQYHARHKMYVHPDQANNIYDYCPNSECSNSEVAKRIVNGCECPCDHCEERM